jgi:hypothetical protein
MNQKIDESQNTFDHLDQQQEKPQPLGDQRIARTGGWVGGAVLIGLGVLLLVQNLGVLHLANSWSLFILIPAAIAFGRAWSSFRETGGRLTATVRSKVLSGLILVLLAGMFLFRLNIFMVGPLLLVLFGAGLLINSVLPE